MGEQRFSGNDVYKLEARVSRQGLTHTYTLFSSVSSYQKNSAFGQQLGDIQMEIDRLKTENCVTLLHTMQMVDTRCDCALNVAGVCQKSYNIFAGDCMQGQFCRLRTTVVRSLFSQAFLQIGYTSN